MSEVLRCHECESGDIMPFEAYAELARVTSDCKPWPAGGSLLLCRRCGLVQASIDERWRQEAAKIYADYDCHYQSGGADQHVYDEVTGRPVKRSEKLVREMMERELIPAEGKMIDVGCGSGAFLRTFGGLLPTWKLYGLEQAPKYEHAIRAIPGVVDFFPTGVEELRGEYSLITMVHVFEHIPNPGGLLNGLAAHLEPEGACFIQVPSYEENPFELVVADHSSHFSGAQLRRVVERAGSEARNEELRWLPKELSLIAGRAAGQRGAEAPVGCVESTVESVASKLEWLKLVAAWGREAREAGSFGIFGTSIAATWLTGVVGGDSIGFYVDEDPGRMGRTHFGKPVHAPRDVPSGSRVFVPLAPSVAATVEARLSGLPFEIINPGKAYA